MSSKKRKNKLLLAIPFLTERGGEEKVVLKTAELFSRQYRIEILTYAYNAKETYEGFKRYKIISWKHARGDFIRSTLFAAAYFSLYKSDADIILAFGFPSYYLVNNNPNTYWYCNTPPKIIHESNNYLPRINPVSRALFCSTIPILKKQELLHVAKLKGIFANSRHIQKKIKRYYNLPSKVIYVGVDSYRGAITFKKELLVVSRLYPEKRVAEIISAGSYLSDYKLIIVGKGPEAMFFPERKQIIHHPSVTEKELHALYARCFATIYIPKDEDFGMIPLESNAHGKMCVGVNDGGLKETIVPGKTGLFTIPTATEIAKTVRELQKLNRTRSRKKSVFWCKSNAKSFSWEKYKEKLEDEICLKTK